MTEYSKDKEIKDNEWKYEQPVKIICGRGAIRELPEAISLIGGNIGLLISGKHLWRGDDGERIKGLCNGKIAAVFSDVSVNPLLDEVEKAAELAKENSVDFIIAVGGGSVIDCAKAVSVAAATENSFKDMYYSGKFPEAGIPLIAVPTTSGTGSEVTAVSVISDNKTGIKKPISCKSFYPAYALSDSALTDSMPPKVIAETGIDAIAHALEAYWSINHQPICDMFAIKSLKLALAWLEKSYFEHGNKEAKDNMAQAALLAGMAFNLPKTTVCHACSFPLTNIYGISHGEAVGLTLDYFLRVNAHGKETERLIILSKELGFKDVDQFADRIADLKNRLNLRTDLKEFDIDEKKLVQLVKESQHPNILGNPVKVTEQMLYNMYKGFI